MLRSNLVSYAVVFLACGAACAAPQKTQGHLRNPPQLEKISRSVVQIKVKVSERMQGGKLVETFEYGTGFFIDARGTILTSAHVVSMVDDARQITVLYNGRALQARIGKKDKARDLATLLVDAGTTVPLVLARRKLRLGEPVYAIGFPYVEIFQDSPASVSGGHLAGLKRTIVYDGAPIEGLLMTDAFVADGCSGGPLVGEDGTVLGVLRFNLAKRGNWLGLSFAEPISSLQSL